MDCGESVFCKLYQQDLLTKYENYYIVITHMHADHVGSLGSLISYMYFVLHKKVHVIHPSEKLVEMLDLTGITREAYEMHLCREFSNGGVRFRAVPVHHADDMACFSYLITQNGQTSYYSGDSYEIPPQVLQDFCAGRIDTIYQDTTNKATGHKSHFPLPELAAVIPPERRSSVVCMHLNCDFETEIAAQGFQSALQYMVI